MGATASISFSPFFEIDTMLRRRSAFGDPSLDQDCAPRGRAGCATGSAPAGMRRARSSVTSDGLDRCQRAQDAPLLFGQAVLAQRWDGTAASPLHAPAAATSAANARSRASAPAVRRSSTCPFAGSSLSLRHGRHQRIALSSRIKCLQCSKLQIVFDAINLTC